MCLASLFFKKHPTVLKKSFRRYYRVSLKSTRSQVYFIDENDWYIHNMAGKMPYYATF